MWRHKILAQVMACCHTSPSHYLNQCWLTIKGVSWHLPEDKFTTRTTRTPAFWDTPAAPWLPILAIHISSQVKTRKVKVTNLKKLQKIQKYFQKALHLTHLLKLLDKLYKYQMDPTRTLGATERTRDAGQTDGRTDERMDGRTETNIPSNNFVVWGI